MKRFVQDAIERAGLGPLYAARRAGDMAEVERTRGSWSTADMMLLGAIADALRDAEVGAVVQIHERLEPGVLWATTQGSELDLLREVASLRVASPPGARVGVEWSRWGLELAQVALGFGASELAGAVTRKSGLPILADERKKVKGEGMVELAAIKRREIAALVTHAGRVPIFAGAREEVETNDAAPAAQEASGA